MDIMMLVIVMIVTVFDQVDGSLIYINLSKSIAFIF